MKRTAKQQQAMEKREREVTLLIQLSWHIFNLMVYGTCSFSRVCSESAQLSESQWRLLRGERLITMAGTESMEWHHTMCFDVFHIIPLQPLQRSGPPQLRCHHRPVMSSKKGCKSERQWWDFQGLYPFKSTPILSPAPCFKWAIWD